MYETRTYRDNMKPEGATSFQVKIEETDLWIAADHHLEEQASALAGACREAIKAIGNRCPDFFTSLVPVSCEAKHPVTKEMLAASEIAGVGPMAAVAGAVSEWVGKNLRDRGLTDEVLVENGGDIYIYSRTERRISIFAGNSPFSEKVAIKLRAEQFPIGICTSAGTVGPSLSFGKADAAVILAPNTALADAVATEAGNRLKTPEDMDGALEYVSSIPGITGCVLIIGDKLGAWGDIELERI